MIDGKTYVVNLGTLTFSQLVTATGIDPTTLSLTFVNSEIRRAKPVIVSGDSVMLSDGDAFTSSLPIKK